MAAVAAKRAEAQARQFEKEVVLTARLFLHWKKELLDAAASGGDIGGLIHKRIACEEHLETLLVAYDDAIVRAGSTPSATSTGVRRAARRQSHRPE
jgi:hypothetical protein